MKTQLYPGSLVVAGAFDLLVADDPNIDYMNGEAVAHFDNGLMCVWLGPYVEITLLVIGAGLKPRLRNPNVDYTAFSHDVDPKHWPSPITRYDTTAIMTGVSVRYRWTPPDTDDLWLEAWFERTVGTVCMFASCDINTPRLIL